MGFTLKPKSGNASFSQGALSYDTAATDPLSGTVNDLNVANASDVSAILINATAAVTLNGLVGGTSNRQLELINQSQFTVTIVANAAGSVAANRFAGAGVILSGETAQLVYNTTLNLWCIAAGASAGAGGVPGGANTNVQYNDGGAFGGDGAFDWNKTTRTLTLGVDFAHPAVINAPSTAGLSFTVGDVLQFTASTVHFIATGAAGFITFVANDECDITANQINFTSAIGFNFTGSTTNASSLWLMGTGADWEIDVDTVLFTGSSANCIFGVNGPVTFTGVNGAAGTPSLLVSSASPSVGLFESDAAANTKWWDFVVNGGVLTGRVYSDAFAANNWISVTRSTNTITSVALTTATMSATLNTNFVLNGPNTGAGYQIAFFDTTNSAFRGFVGIGTNTVAGAAVTDFAISPGAGGSVVIGTANGGAIGTRFGPTGNVTFGQPPKVPSYTVATLPSAATSGLGSLAMVTDSTLTAITGLGLAPTGGGGNKVMVYSDGTSWLML